MKLPRRRPRLVLYYLIVFGASYAFSFVLIWGYSSRRYYLWHSPSLSWIAVLAGLLAVYAVFLFRKKG